MKHITCYIGSNTCYSDKHGEHYQVSASFFEDDEHLIFKSEEEADAVVLALRKALRYGNDMARKELLSWLSND